MTGALLAWIGLCWAGSSSTLDGSTGLIVAPVADTVPAGKVLASISGQASWGWDGASFAGLPAGIALGASQRLELGAHMLRDARRPVPDRTGTAAGGVHARLRLVDPFRGRPGFAVQPAVRGFGADPAAEYLAVISWGTNGHRLAVSAGPRHGLQTPGVDGLFTGGFEVLGGRPVGLVADATASVGRYGVHSWSGRGALRVHPAERLVVMPWGGGGRYEDRPWLAFGTSVTFASASVRSADRDDDGVADWSDQCPYHPEDPDGWEDEDGCDDPDNDGDGIRDENDPTPNGEALEEPLRHKTDTPQLDMKIKPKALPKPVNRGPGNTGWRGD